MKSITSDLKSSIISQLIDIQEITKLCAFASEARRVLNDIDVAIEIDSTLGELLSKDVTARNEWNEHQDNVGMVLKNLGYQLEAVINQVNEAEATNGLHS